ncbi:MAG: hypothetical protein HKN67_01665 [Saprospiraceae bacterium]|nr:hypothetical protein [Saprospiraceae bacterium]
MKNSIFNKLFCIFLLTFGIHISPCKAFKGKYPIKNFTPEEYRAGIQNIDFAQNRDMSLFIANNLGVLTFNGNEWKTQASNTGKKQRALAFDEHFNRLYVGSQGDFGYFENDWNYVSLSNKIPADFHDFDEVWDVYIYDSKVYYCTFRAIYAYDQQSLDVIQHTDGFNRSFIAGNRIFTQTPKGEIFEISDLQLSKTITQNISNQIVAGIISKDEGYLIFYNSGQIEFSTPFSIVEAYPNLVAELKGKYINHVLQLSDTRLVISTQTAGIYLFDLQTRRIENISIKEGLQSNACLRAFQDYTGNLWLGLQNGIALLDINSPLMLINQDIDLQGSGYEAFDTDEGTYYSTSNGIYFLTVNTDRAGFLLELKGQRMECR